MPCLRSFRRCGRLRIRCATTLTGLTISCRRRCSKPGTTSTSLRKARTLRAWLFTILRNCYFSELRKKSREVEDVDGKMTDSVSVAPAQQGHLDMQDLRKALTTLPDEQREALILIGAVGMSYEEAAGVAQCAVGTIKSRVYRARTKLAELLDTKEPDVFGPDARAAAVVIREL